MNPGFRGPIGGLDRMRGPDARAALPALAAGGLGLLAGLLGVALDLPVLGVLAGVLALVTGFAASQLAGRLEEQGAVQRLVEDELRTVRSEARSTEAELRAEVETLSADGGFDGGLADDEFDSAYDDGTDALIDPETGLFAPALFTIALDSRVAAARRHLRPVAIAYLEVVEGLPVGEPVVTDPATVTDAIRATLREADTACRLDGGGFALLLEDTPENGAIWTVERIRRSLGESRADLTLWAGVACYPAHALSATELRTAAEAALVSAREWRQDRIEVAAAVAD